MRSPANLVRAAVLATVIAGLALLLPPAEGALAHGDCEGTSTVSSAGTTAWFSGRSECSQEVTQISVMATLWSFDPSAQNISASFEDISLDIDYDINGHEQVAFTSDSDGMASGRCYVAISAHEAFDAHWHWFPPRWDPHLWSTITFAPGLVCRN